MNKKIQYIIDEITDQYLYADDGNRPWIIGFSGGKDSTVLLQLVWKAIEQIKDFQGIVKRDVYVVCNDTMVENPIITEYVYRVLDKIEQASVEQGINIQTIKTIPRLEDSFWVNLIGRGYPAPNNTFRWCTERLKIKPTSRFLLEQVDEKGEALLLLGTRKAESASRAKSIEKHQTKGKRINKHSSHPNTYIYAPIKELNLEEVWYIINAMPSPWGADNSELFQIYSDASADDYECPTMVVTDKHKSCGQSRFGCWTCTVVKQDKSMSALIDNGLGWLKPLLDYRNLLSEERNVSENREPHRRNGQQAINEDGEHRGVYTPKYRAKLLERLLETQKEIQKMKPYLQLITNQELIAIQALWNRDLIFEYKVSEFYNKIFKNELDMKNTEKRQQEEYDILKESCENNMEDVELIQDLLTLQKHKSLLNRKRGFRNDIERRIEEYLKQKSE